MSNKDPKNFYKVIDHAIEMFEENSICFSTIKNEFDILPYSKLYYNKNKKQFIHKDEMEIYLLVIELTNLGYIEKTGNDFNYVTITLKGHSFLANCNRT